ncbi:hypothetical protein FKP32DRAFT_548813 [Trametes sanguinea]|nr:hypothetical protein FKP32DRAFT_548813 [Trametes sanguinea]
MLNSEATWLSSDSSTKVRDHGWFAPVLVHGFVKSRAGTTAAGGRCANSPQLSHGDGEVLTGGMTLYHRHFLPALLASLFLFCNVQALVCLGAPMGCRPFEVWDQYVPSPPASPSDIISRKARQQVNDRVQFYRQGHAWKRRELACCPRAPPICVPRPLESAIAAREHLKVALQQACLVVRRTLIYFQIDI